MRLKIQNTRVGAPSAAPLSASSRCRRVPTVTTMVRCGLASDGMKCVRNAFRELQGNVARIAENVPEGGKATFASLSIASVAPLALLFGGGNGGGNNFINGEGGDGNGGGDGGSYPQELYVIADEDASEESSEEEGSDGDEDSDDETDESGDEDDAEDNDSTVADGFFCNEIKAQGLPVGEGIPTEEDLFASLNCQAGFTCSRAELSQDIKQLYNTGLFESVNAKVLPEKKGKFSVVFDFVEKRYPEIKTFAVEGAKVLPKSIVDETNRKLEAYKGQAFTMETMAAIKNVIEGWYQARGFGLSYISHFTGMPTGNVVAHVNEGRTAKVGVVYVDEDGNPTQKKGSIPASFILKHCPVEVGTLYSMNDGRKTLQNVFALDLFDNVQVFPKQNEKDPSRVEVDVMVREKPLQTADLEMEWAVAPNDNNRPSLVSLVPGGTITYEHRNLGGRAGTLAASVNTKSFLAPSEDLAYRMVYTQPFIYGLDDPKKTKVSGTVFNSRKLCGVFTPGPSGDEVPVVWVDRAGAKVALTEQYSRNSTGSFGLVAQEISTLDENGALCPRGMRSNAYGQYIADGPPTTLSGTGKDRMVYAQGSLTRDTTYVVNGQQVGSRDIFTVRNCMKWLID
jgi:outer membrane protein assembly factor BamA